MIYYVEDDKNIRDLLVYALTQTGLPAQGFQNAADFYRALDRETPELVILDVMLPGEDGFSILRALRARSDTCMLPIMMLTAKGAEYDRVYGLEAGADDYVTKPFGVMEMIARVKAVMRRAAPCSLKTTLRYGGVELNAEKHTVTANGQPVQLTYKEFELLKFLMAHAGAAFDREKLLAAVWDTDYFGGTRTIDVHIQTLRQKLGNCEDIIETVRGVGYRIGDGHE